jgi:hypothetical protein
MKLLRGEKQEAKATSNTVLSFCELVKTEYGPRTAGELSLSAIWTFSLAVAEDSADCRPDSGIPLFDMCMPQSLLQQWSIRRQWKEQDLRQDQGWLQA